MELITWYICGAILVAVMAMVDLYHPVLSKREMRADTRVLFYMTFFIIALLTAPLLIYPCVSRLKGVEFRDSIDKALFE